MAGTRPFRIVVAEPYDAAALARLQEVGEVTVLTDSAPESLLAAVANADALCVRAKAHVTARIIEAGTNLKVIARASPTVDHIDLRAAHKRSIPVVYAPHVAVVSTAEFTLAVMLAAHRRVCSLDRQMRDGKFDALRAPAGHELCNQTLALLGVDPVAEVLGRMCSAAFGMKILYHDSTGRTPTDFKGTSRTLDELLTEGDILSLHLPASPATKGILNAERIAMLKPNAIVMNTCRGSLIDTTALAHALKRRLIGGAAIDVFETEPLPMDHPLRFVPNCILTPHVAGATLDASADRFNVADDVVRVLTGKLPLHAFESVE